MDLLIVKINENDETAMVVERNGVLQVSPTIPVKSTCRLCETTSAIGHVGKYSRSIL